MKNKKGQETNVTTVGNYYMGLDIGTNSVGWAVSTPDYRLLKAKGHKMWGSRLFDEGITAEEKRVHRNSRRRLMRRNERLRILENLFAQEISKVDLGFFQRLKESKYHFEDKTVKNKYVLFGDENYTDQDFYDKYPTIYHLRAALMKTAPEDIRELFIAVHHILKHRGNFLYEGENISTDGNLGELLKELFVSLDLGQEFQKVDAEAIKTLLIDRVHTKSDKAKSFAELFDKTKKKQMEAIAKLVLGLKANVDELLAEPEYKEILDKDRSLSFKNSDFDEERSKYEDILLDKMSILDICKRIYDCILLAYIIPEGLTFSEAKVETYKKHAEDLKSLKELLRADKALYQQVLITDEKDLKNYIQYTRHSKTGKTCSKDDFYSFLKKSLEKISDSSAKSKILQQIDLEDFLPLQKVKDNGVVPYQVHREELRKILKLAESKYPFLQVKEDGYSVSEKIVKLLEFRIPYYVGPLNTHHRVKEQGYSWVVRKQAGHVYPWNFSELVDEAKSAEAFITNMTNKCTYLVGEDVLPKNSLIYSEFMLLNELNNVRYDGQPLSYDLKQSLIEEVFKQDHKKVTAKFLKTFFAKKGVDNNGIFTGFDVDIKSDLKSYRDMERILGDGFDKDMAEHLILWITLFGDAKKILKQTIKENYPKLSDVIINKILKLKYKDWGALSYKFLNGIKGQLETEDVPQTIISYMRDTTFNLMELLNSHGTFVQTIKNINNDLVSDNADTSYQLVEEMAGSPAIKRATWQAIRLIQEVVSIRKEIPRKIFIEVTRTNKADKKKTSSRKDQIIALYNAIKKDAPSWAKELKSLEAGKFNSKKMYLYYLQMGKCAYSGETIDITQLDNYDIDHIYPRSLTKDNSFDNMVLVKKELNREKSDTYPINKNIREAMKNFWTYLYGHQFMSARKYERLVRSDKLTADELAGFINRQIVETSQSVKATAKLLERLYPQTEVVYVKAENVSDFRQANNFIKVRCLNDHHHAKDAYLNIVVGNVYNEKFTKNAWNYVKENKGQRTYNLAKLFDHDLIKKGVSVWNAKDSLEVVKTMMASNDVLVTKKTSEGKGALFDATIVKASAIGSSEYLPLKGGDSPLSDIKKYGAYTSLSTAYFTIVRGKNKKGEIETHLIGIPLHLKNQFREISDYEAYAKMQLPKLNDLEVVYKKLCSGTLIKYNGFYYRVGGRTGKQFYINKFVQVLLNNQDSAYFKQIEKYGNLLKVEKNLNIPNSKISNDRNIELFKTLCFKLKKPYFLKMKGNIVDDLLEGGLHIFMDMNLDMQIKALLNILNYINNQISIVDLKDLGSKSARLVLGLNISNAEEFKIITESVTGLYQKEIKII